MSHCDKKSLLALLLISLFTPRHVLADPQIYDCPADNGAKYTTGGIIFELKCDQGTTAKRLDDVAGIASQAACADLCAAAPRCQSCDWNVNTLNCARFLEYIPTVSMSRVNTWFPITKRPDPPPPLFKSCPDDDGKTYSTKDGTFYRIKCRVHTMYVFIHTLGLSSLFTDPEINASSAANTPSDLIKTVPSTESIQACMEACSNTQGCLSVDYVQRVGDHKLKDCDLYKSGGEDPPDTTCASKSVDMAYAIDPPVADGPDEGSVLCSTDCPFANGQVCRLSDLN
ncbi:hypothetical protein NHQ30_003705 [Ciborinia camelliae]|nr:hypothetical protein NHQ30_003705 [Ciborinia camelliae]